MKKHTLFLFVLLAVSCSVSGQVKIAAEDAAKHVGEKVTVCAKVFSARFLSSSNGTPTLVNLGGAYPNELLTVVIFGEDRGKFKEKPEEAWKDKTICVTGKISEYRGKPQIVVNQPEQVVVQ